MTDGYTIEWETRDGRTMSVTAPNGSDAVAMYRELSVSTVGGTSEELEAFRKYWQAQVDDE